MFDDGVQRARRRERNVHVVLPDRGAAGVRVRPPRRLPVTSSCFGSHRRGSRRRPSSTVSQLHEQHRLRRRARVLGQRRRDRRLQSRGAGPGGRFRSRGLVALRDPQSLLMLTTRPITFPFRRADVRVLLDQLVGQIARCRFRASVAPWEHVLHAAGLRGRRRGGVPQVGRPGVRESYAPGGRARSRVRRADRRHGRRAAADRRGAAAAARRHGRRRTRPLPGMFVRHRPGLRRHLAHDAGRNLIYVAAGARRRCTRARSSPWTPRRRR